MFDLPVMTKAQRRGANKYRLMLYEAGFAQVQFSVYAKYLVNATGVRGLLPTLRAEIPDDGEVRVLRLTDEQWAGTYRSFGRVQVASEAIPTQLDLFADGKNLPETPITRGRDRTGVKSIEVKAPKSDQGQAISPTLPPT